MIRSGVLIYELLAAFVCKIEYQFCISLTLGENQRQVMSRRNNMWARNSEELVFCKGREQVELEIFKLLNGGLLGNDTGFKVPPVKMRLQAFSTRSLFIQIDLG